MKPPPPKYRGLLRAATIGRIIAEDVAAGDVPLERTLRDVIEANEVTFDPPYTEENLQALARARLEAEGVALDD